MGQADHYITSTASATGLTEEARQLIKDRFGRLVNFWQVDNQELMDPEISRIKRGELERLYGEHANDLSRFCSISRLPNTFLFGADTVGPDLTQAFSEMILGSLDAKLFLEKADRFTHMLYRRFKGRNIHPYEKEEIEKIGFTIDDVLSAHPPNDLTNRTKMLQGGEGSMVIFYDPDKMPQKLIPKHHSFNFTLYPIPPIEAVTNILVAWYKPLILK